MKITQHHCVNCGKVTTQNHHFVYPDNYTVGTCHECGFTCNIGIYNHNVVVTTTNYSKGDIIEFEGRRWLCIVADKEYAVLCHYSLNRTSFKRPIVTSNVPGLGLQGAVVVERSIGEKEPNKP